ncbi:MAG: hypothetical protein IT254_06325 [Chitinophagaceae bacterium]|nr:hypothetical protein [Chitinophagaceae bacterium]MCW5916889.1 hypothetical protein [Ferruginibacter sp.]
MPDIISLKRNIPIDFILAHLNELKVKRILLSFPKAGVEVVLPKIF